MKRFIVSELRKIQNGYSVCGIIDRRKRIYPLGSDTKMLSCIFEIISRQAISRYANRMGLILQEPKSQNYYPDFTLMRSAQDRKKVAVDVKTTYRMADNDLFEYTLGGYASFMSADTPDKNILYPYYEYKKHWILGFVYNRDTIKNEMNTKIYDIADLSSIPLPFTNVEVFMQEKWKISSDRAGSGNTTNIGSINGTIHDFINGNSVFSNENEFLNYWRGYKKTAQERKKYYSTIAEYRTRHGMPNDIKYRKL